MSAREGSFDEPLVDGFLDQGSGGAGADLALIEREHDKTLDGLVEVVVILRTHVGEEDVR